MTSSAATYAALQQAAEWYATLQSSDCDDAQRAQWQAWLDASPQHETAWQKIESVSQQFQSLPAQPAHAALKQGARRRATVKKLLMLACAVGTGGALSQRESREYLTALNAGERTTVGETRHIALADGSQLYLNTASAVDIDYAGNLRRVVLRRGELLLQSSADSHSPSRRLVVDAPHGRLTALGTRFSVYLDGDRTRLSVFDGAVRVEPADGGQASIAVAGAQLHFGRDWIGPAELADPNQAAWIRQRISADNMRLQDFIATLSRYTHRHLGCHSAVACLRLTGSFPLSDIDGILQAIAASLPVRVQRVLPWWTSLEPLPATHSARV